MIRIVCLHATVQIHVTLLQHQLTRPICRTLCRLIKAEQQGNPTNRLKNKNLSTNLNSPAHQPFYEPDDEKQMKTLKVSPKVTLIGALIENL